MSHETLFPMVQTERTSDDYYTPKWLFDAMQMRFDLDVACPPEGPLFTPADAWHTQQSDGLTADWWGRVWMNPPYSKPAPWVERFIEHGDGVALLPFAKSKWCQSLWDSNAAMVYVRAVTFERSDLNVISQAPFSLGLWAFGNECVQAIARVGKVR